MKAKVLIAMALTTGTIFAVGYIANSQNAGPALARAQSWGYQLQHLEPGVLSQSDVDVLVIDHSRNGAEDGRLRREEITALKAKPDGSRRVVLSYISIGEAEDYRHYWRDEWFDTPPAWLGAENPDWPGNYHVDYWEQRWQQIIFGDADSLLDIIIDQGFDGAYLDRVDAYYGHPASAEIEMVRFVRNLADYARTHEPKFLIVQQNAEELLNRPEHVPVIDGLAKEDLFFGIDGNGTPNPAATIANSLSNLERLKQAGTPIFVVEYGLDPSLRQAARLAAEREDFVITFTTRPLDTPPGHR